MSVAEERDIAAIKFVTGEWSRRDLAQGRYLPGQGNGNGHEEPPPGDGWDDPDEEREPPGESTSRPFGRVDLGALMREGMVEPAFVPGALRWLYAGRLTAIQSEPGVGKTWVALWLAKQTMEAGRNVLYLDEEGGPELVTERLVAFGCDPALVSERLWYHPFPARAWDLDDLAALAELVAEAEPALAVFDSLPDFLAMAGKSEDSAQEVTWWINRVCGVCRAAGCAQVVLDHLVKPDPDKSKRTQGRYARGSGAKLAKVDASFLIETGKEFDAHSSGQLKLWKTKDRRGRLSLPSIGSSPVLIEVTVEAGQVTMTVRDPEPEQGHGGLSFRPTGLMERVSRNVEQYNEAGIRPSVNKALDGVEGRREYKQNALACLVNEGWVRRVGGPNNSTLHVVERPYREFTDSRADGFVSLAEDERTEDF